MVEISMVIVRRKNSIYNWIEHHLLSFYDPFWEEFETSFCEETHMAKAVTYCAQNKKLGFLCRYVAAFLLFIIKTKKKEKKNEPKRNQNIVSKVENAPKDIAFAPPSMIDQQ